MSENGQTCRKNGPDTISVLNESWPYRWIAIFRTVFAVRPSTVSRYRRRDVNNSQKPERPKDESFTHNLQHRCPFLDMPDTISLVTRVKTIRFPFCVSPWRGGYAVGEYRGGRKRRKEGAHVWTSRFLGSYKDLIVIHGFAAVNYTKVQFGDGSQHNNNGNHY